MPNTAQNRTHWKVLTQALCSLERARAREREGGELAFKRRYLNKYWPLGYKRKKEQKQKKTPFLNVTQSGSVEYKADKDRTFGED